MSELLRKIVHKYCESRMELENIGLHEAVAGDLPKDILVEILSRLPTKSLVRFMSVHKSWFNMFKDQSFNDLHLACSNSSSANAHLAFIEYDSEAARYYISLRSLKTYTVSRCISIPHVEISKHYNRIVGCCNGVFCLHYYCLHFYCLGKGSLYLFNPATNEIKVIPDLDCLGYNWQLGFGFDPKTKDYKVVSISTALDARTNEKNCSIVHVYNLSTDSGRRIGNYENGTIDTSVFHTLVLMGNLHWMAVRANGIQFVMVFDIHKEVISDIMLPDLLTDSECTIPIDTLFVFKESLSLIIPQWLVGGQELYDVWVMSEYGVNQSWVKLLSIGPIGQGPFIRHMSNVVRGYCGKNGEILLTDETMTKLYLCNPSFQTIQNLQAFKPQGYRSRRFTVTYNGSLVPLSGKKALPLAKRDWKTIYNYFSGFLCFAIACYTEHGSSRNDSVQ